MLAQNPSDEPPDDHARFMRLFLSSELEDDVLMPTKGDRLTSEQIGQHLLGLDHERLSCYHNGVERRLTAGHGKVIGGILS
jgi:hypothetical protein